MAPESQHPLRMSIPQCMAVMALSDHVVILMLDLLAFVCSPEPSCGFIFVILTYFLS